MTIKSEDNVIYIYLNYFRKGDT